MSVNCKEKVYIVKLMCVLNTKQELNCKHASMASWEFIKYRIAGSEVHNKN